MNLVNEYLSVTWLHWVSIKLCFVFVWKERPLVFLLIEKFDLDGEGDGL